MDLKTLLDNDVKGEVIATMTNEAYKKICEEKLNKEIQEIQKAYGNSLIEASKYYVR